MMLSPSSTQASPTCMPIFGEIVVIFHKPGARLGSSPPAARVSDRATPEPTKACAMKRAKPREQPARRRENDNDRFSAIEWGNVEGILSALCSNREGATFIHHHHIQNDKTFAEQRAPWIVTQRASPSIFDPRQRSARSLSRLDIAASSDFSGFVAGDLHADADFGDLRLRPGHNHLLSFAMRRGARLLSWRQRRLHLQKAPPQTSCFSRFEPIALVLIGRLRPRPGSERKRTIWCLRPVAARSTADLRAPGRALAFQ
jgi:hypothetical protein